MSEKVNNKYYSGFYPVKLGLLVVASNFFPIAWWTIASKDPFQFVLAIDKQNYSLSLLKDLKECILQFMPWELRQQTIQAGYLTGRKADKASKLKLTFQPATVLTKTQLLAGFESAFELKVIQEVPSEQADHQLIIGEVLHVHRRKRGVKKDPIFFNGYRSFARMGEEWDFQFGAAAQSVKSKEVL